MKKILLTILLTVILITGCNKNQFKIGEESKIETISNEEVTLSIKKDTLNNKETTLILTNNTDKTYKYSNQYILEIYKDNKWYDIDVTLNEDLTPIDILPNETKEIEINWENSYGALSKGKYRIIKSINYENEEGIYEGFNISVEFNIK